MKKFILLGALSALALTSWRDDDSNSESIVGTWKCAKTVTYDGSSSTVLETYIPNSCESKTTLEFGNNGNVVSNRYNENSSGNCVSETDTQTYSYNNDTKTLNVDGEGYEVTTLTSSSLVFQYYVMDADGTHDKMTFHFYK